MLFLLCSTFVLRVNSLLQSSTTGALVDNDGIPVTIGDIPYFIPTLSTSSLSLSTDLDNVQSVYGFVPLAVIKTSASNFTTTLFETTISNYSAQDDVFNPSFLQVVYIFSSGALEINIEQANLDAYNTSFLLKSASTGCSVVPPGPYFYQISTGTLHQAYRLYADTQQAFHWGAIPATNNSFAELPVAIPGSSSTTIAVPSRLYYSTSSDLPLAGVRVGIKDIYDVKGLKTGAGNRAYYEIYPPASENSLVVQRLVDSGAIIVGKMKTAQFAAPENARDAIDYQVPFNPRGDGCQEVGSSSSGPGAGIAAYDWLDLTLSSDTGGSVRVPAEDQGVYGNRPSHGIVELTGVVSLAAEWDTAGLLARDPLVWLKDFWIDPKKIQVYSFPDANASTLSEEDYIHLAFLGNLTEFLSANVSTINYTALWEETHPINIPSSLDDLLQYTWITPCAHEQTELVRDPFYADYGAKYNNRTPYINPSTRSTWEFSDSHPEFTIADAITNQTIFKDWWDGTINSGNNQTCSDSILLFVAKNATPTYRDTPGDYTAALDLFAASFVSVFLEAPEYVLSIGEVPYNSTVTFHEEALPVTVNIMAAKGCDGMLFSLIEDLTAAGILSAVETGGTIKGGQVYL